MGAFINGLLTVLTSGIVSALATTFLNFRQAERQARQAKLEELCGILHKQLAHLLNMHKTMERLATEKRNPTEDELKAIREGDSLPHDRVRSLIAIYFPSLSANYEMARKIALDFSNAQKAKAEPKVLVEIAHRLAVNAAVMLDDAIALAPSVNTPLWHFW